MDTTISSDITKDSDPQLASCKKKAVNLDFMTDDPELANAYDFNVPIETPIMTCKVYFILIRILILKFIYG